MGHRSQLCLLRYPSNTFISSKLIFKRKELSMPIKELLTLSTLILGGIAVTHPLDFQRAILRTEYSVLKEASRTNNWGDLSFAAAKRASRAEHHRHLSAQ
jgi:hypothetical protein